MSALRVALALACAACSFRPAPGGQPPDDAAGNPSDAPADATADAPSDSPISDAMIVPIDAAIDAPPAAAPSHGQTIVAEQANTSSITSGNVTGTADGRYFATVVYRGMQPLTTVSGLNVTWTRVRNHCGGEGKIMVEVWTASGPASSGSVTAQFPAQAAYSVITVSRYDNVASLGASIERNSSPTGTQCGTEGWETTTYSTSLAPQQANGHVFVAVGKRSESHSPGAGYTEREEQVSGSTNSAGVVIMDRPFTGTGAVTVNGAFGDLEEWAVIAVELQR